MFLFVISPEVGFSYDFVTVIKSFWLPVQTLYYRSFCLQVDQYIRNKSSDIKDVIPFASKKETIYFSPVDLSMVLIPYNESVSPSKSINEDWCFKWRTYRLHRQRPSHLWEWRRTTESRNCQVRRRSQMSVIDWICTVLYRVYQNLCWIDQTHLSFSVFVHLFHIQHWRSRLR